MSDEKALAELREENAHLRARLEKIEAEAAEASARRSAVGKFGLRLLLPALDRKRVVRSFIDLFRVVGEFSGPKSAWPSRGRVAEHAEAFGVAVVRFTIRRRFVWLFFSLLAVMIPVMQLWLVSQQNRLVNLQNQLFNIQADDIVARGVTSDNLLINELNGALLSGREIGALNRMLNRIFSAKMGGMMGGLGVDDGRFYLSGTAGRAHLLLALSEALRRPQSEKPISADGLWEMVNDEQEGAFSAAVAESAEGRLFVTLGLPRSAYGAQGARLEAECRRYLLGLSQVLRRGWSLALSADEEAAFFARVAPLFARLSQLNPSGDQPLLPALVQTFAELLIDLNTRPIYGEPEKPLPENVDEALKAGFEVLRQGLIRQKAQGIRWKQLASLLEVPV